MFDVSSAVPPNEDDSDGEDAEGSTSRFKNVEINDIILLKLLLAGSSMVRPSLMSSSFFSLISPVHAITLVH